MAELLAMLRRGGKTLKFVAGERGHFYSGLGSNSIGIPSTLTELLPGCNPRLLGDAKSRKRMRCITTATGVY
jgi:hypothetical protein